MRRHQMSDSLPAQLEAGAGPTVRRRGDLARQANRYLARFVVARPGATAEEPRREDALLAATLERQRLLPPLFAELSQSIDLGAWGEELELLAETCGLGDSATDVLGILAAPEFDPEVRLALRRATGASGNGLELDLLRAILDPCNVRVGELLDALDAGAPLRRYALVDELVSPDGRRVLSLPLRVLRLLVDLPLRSIDESLRHAVRFVDAPEEGPSPSPSLSIDEALARIGDRHALLVGAPGLGQPPPRRRARRRLRRTAFRDRLRLSRRRAASQVVEGRSGEVRQRGGGAEVGRPARP